MSRHAAWFRLTLFAAALAAAALSHPVVSAAGPADDEVGRATGGRGTWIDVGPMSSPHENASAIRLRSGRVLVMGGSASYDCCCLRTVDLYQPGTGQWLRRESMPHRRCSTAVLLRDGRVLVAGGYGYRPKNGLTPALATALLYDPRRDHWRSTTSMHHRGPANGVLLPDGRVLMTSRGNPAWAEIYNPRTQVWRRATPSATSHSVLVRLGNGQVLAIGAEGDRQKVCAERYLPGPARWVPTRHYRWPCPVYLTASLMRNGRVMVVSGQRHVRVYTPTTNRWRSLPPLPLSRAQTSPAPWAIVPVTGRTMVIASRAGCLSSEQNPSTPRPRTVGLVWQPRHRSWTRWTTLSDGAMWPSVTPMRDGSVLVAGGVQWHFCPLVGDHTPSTLAYRYYPDR